MKRIGALGIPLICLAAPHSVAETDEARAAARKALAEAIDGQPEITGKFEAPEDGYHQGHLILRKADKTTDATEARHLREQALGLFGEVKKRFPDWKPAMVDIRIRTTRDLLGVIGPAGPE